ncbi:hypothetical protein Ahy_A02g008968 [Arachis hypogaea]|uniref:CCHC-type domain-containing protein n=1 Tax=Arachis hypogaea TaxID=3818 RepID=A0A445EG50_ARAHY|nr:hypothetical protein Ahy_A02g008968 [Arachis hypogaea]
MNLQHTCMQTQRVGIIHSKWLGNQFKKKVESNLRLKIKELVAKTHKKWNLTVTKSIIAKTKQEALSQIQGAFTEQYKRINDYCAELLRANPGSSVYLKCYQEVIHPLNGPNLWERTQYDGVMPPPYKRPSHRPMKKRKRGPGDEENRSQNHLSQRGQIQRCSNCGDVGYKKMSCTKPKKSVYATNVQGFSSYYAMPKSQHNKLPKLLREGGSLHPNNSLIGRKRKNSSLQPNLPATQSNKLASKPMKSAA